MTLDDAVKDFESRFKSVSTDVKQQYDRTIPVLWSGGPRAFEEGSWALFAAKDAAVAEWLEAAKSIIEGSVLKWIVKPEILEFQITIADKIGRHRSVSNRFAVKSQFTTGDE